MIKEFFLKKEIKALSDALDDVQKLYDDLSRLSKATEFFERVGRAHCRFALNNPKHKNVERQFFYWDMPKVIQFLEIKDLKFDKRVKHINRIKEKIMRENPDKDFFFYMEDI